MNPASRAPVTKLLHAWSDGDERALGDLIPFVYDELRRRARGFVARERQGNTLQTTAFVNEAYLHMVESAAVRCQDRAHFFAIAAQIMRRILVDAARARQSAKRGGAYRQIPLEEDSLIHRGGDRELLALDAALAALSGRDERKAKVVELRFFAGLSVAETARTLRVSEDTVGRDWNFAKAWLEHEVR